MEFPDLESQIEALWNRKLANPIRIPGVNEALGVPAIFGAVSLIADTAGSLSLEAFRNGSILTEADTPRLVQRPNPFSTPRAFFRDTAYYQATRGEFWWWVASRDVDGVAQSLYPVPPWEVMVSTNERNRLRPNIEWLGRQMPNEDMVHGTYMPGPDGLRGVGPLQLCGAAVSVAVEAADWAANFFSGSVPSIIGTTAADLSEADLKEMDKQWNEKPAGMPRWLTNDLTLSASPFDASKAQLTESRQHQVGEVARMFNMPGALIEYQMGGSSLTYQNQENIWGDFQRRCLSPHFLEPIEQELSDLLTRSTAARFNLKQLLRADPKTRADVYASLIPLGVMTPDEAREAEGFAPGSVDFASVPPQLPGATPNLLPVNRSTAGGPVRCPNGHLLAEQATPPYRFTCFRCKETVAA
jgi:HK97 family phage portal protein